jgi:hypothetical protein
VSNRPNVILNIPDGVLLSGGWTESTKRRGEDCRWRPRVLLWLAVQFWATTLAGQVRGSGLWAIAD